MSDLFWLFFYFLFCNILPFFNFCGYFLKKVFEKAILEYEKVIVKYPEGDKVSSALLKQGLAFLELGDKTHARNLLKRVTDRFPQTEQAEIAKKKLETIK